MLVVNCRPVVGSGENPGIDTEEREDTPITPPAVEPGQEALEPFNEDVFNIRRAAWEARELDYIFTQVHSGSGIDLSVTIRVDKHIPGRPPSKNDPEPLLFCSTISELYEKIAALWSESRYTPSSFLIKYDGKPLSHTDWPQFHYPTEIQIKNINDSGNDYTVRICIDGLILWV
jgi:hypothetical protein